MNTQAFSLVAYEEKDLDKGVITGIILSFALIACGMLLSGRLGSFLNPAGILIVIGGTISASLVHYSLKDLSYALQLAGRTLRQADNDPLATIQYLVRTSQAVKQEGMLYLDREATRQSDPFMKKAMEITADGQDASVIKRILETEMRSSHHRASRAVQVFQTMGTYAPALGLIGTLIGLIQMLGALGDAASVGPAMAVALTGTFYGAVMANLLFLPISGKIKSMQEEELLLKAITVEAMMSMSRNESSIVMEQRLQSFLPIDPRGA
ncbi:MAG: motility protein A [SAR324 cluster bacterium]|uniref:Motility protein A n=1 Tax=SAR324 cluster bacterium TaxID=2024889 RepID=A0A7X9FSI1_9DELT|nr:motility protein A [SAR324 cluster bacterium]